LIRRRRTERLRLLPRARGSGTAPRMNATTYDDLLNVGWRALPNDAKCFEHLEKVAQRVMAALDMKGLPFRFEPIKRQYNLDDERVVNGNFAIHGNRLRCLIGLGDVYPVTASISLELYNGKFLLEVAGIPLSLAKSPSEFNETIKKDFEERYQKSKAR